jgi:chemotaxis protein CheD
MSTHELEYPLEGGGSIAPGRRPVYLHPGELVASNEPAAIKTILGSCIAVCLWDGDYGIGGMNHYVMPQGAASNPNPGRFGCFAIPRLIDAMVAQGARAVRLQAKLFGGAAMITSAAPRANHVGMQNLKIANELLERAGIPVIACDVGGARGRKIVFHSDDGSVGLWTL